MNPARGESCPCCGATVAGGEGGCQRLMDEIMARAASDTRYAGIYRLAFDAYCMQHVEKYGASAKSYAAHLTGLCCGVERDGDRALYDAIPRWLNGPVPLEKPPLVRERGRLNILHVRAADDPSDHEHAVRRWAAQVWEAYASQHELAREWLDTAVRVPARRPA